MREMNAPHGLTNQRHFVSYKVNMNMFYNPLTVAFKHNYICESTLIGAHS